METKEYRYVDKSKWGRGEWQDEPDKIQWTDEDTGLPCLVVRGPSGALCGYVGVSEGHRFFGKEYSSGDYDSEEYRQSPGSLLEAHGGITFSDFCRESPDHRGICHIPGPGEPDRVWWLGFDCAHYGDHCPAFDRGFSHESDYKNLFYVQSECRSLAQQLTRYRDENQISQPGKEQNE